MTIVKSINLYTRRGQTPSIPYDKLLERMPKQKPSAKKQVRVEKVMTKRVVEEEQQLELFPDNEYHYRNL